MKIVPIRVYIGSVIFGCVFGCSTTAYILGRMGIPTILPLPWSFFVMVGSGILLAVSIVGLLEVAKEQVTIIRVFANPRLVNVPKPEKRHPPKPRRQKNKKHSDG